SGPSARPRPSRSRNATAGRINAVVRLSLVEGEGPARTVRTPAPASASAAERPAGPVPATRIVALPFSSLAIVSTCSQSGTYRSRSHGSMSAGAAKGCGAPHSGDLVFHTLRLFMLSEPRGRDNDARKEPEEEGNEGEGGGWRGDGRALRFGPPQGAPFVNPPSGRAFMKRKKVTAPQAKAFSVHLLTASGSFLAFLSLVAASEERWTAMFWWLGLALVVRGSDGPIGRELQVKRVRPPWSADTLLNIIAYVTYVVFPAFALYQSGFVGQGLSFLSAAIIVVSSAI